MRQTGHGRSRPTAGDTSIRQFVLSILELHSFPTTRFRALGLDVLFAVCYSPTMMHGKMIR